METTILAGLVVGSIYVLVALGFNIVYLTSSVFNFAQAAIVMFGTFLAHQLGVVDGLPLPLVLVVCALGGALIGIVVEFAAIRPVRGRGAHSELVTTLGAAVVLEGIAVLIWGDQALRVPTIVSSDVVSVAGGRVAVDGLVLIGFAVLAFLAIWGWTRLTLGGLSCLAISENRDAARLRGINVNWMAIMSMATAGGLGGLAGPFVGTETFAVVTLGTAIILKAFLALAVGGFGSLPGAAVGGFTVGLVEVSVARYFGAERAQLTLFVLLLVFLSTMPTGLFGQKKERVV
jgi:branched-chain amino acid transport system permease protein